MTTTMDWDSLPKPQVTEITDDIRPPIRMADEDSADTGTCAECGKPTFRPPGITPKGRRKRIPKYCADHTARPTSNAPSPSRRSKHKGNVDIADGMTEMYATIGMFALAKDQTLGSMLLGGTRIQRLMEQDPAEMPMTGIADDAGAAWGKIAEQYPGIERYLGGMLQTSAFAELLGAHAPLLVYGASKRKGPLRIRFPRFKRKRKEPLQDE